MKVEYFQRSQENKHFQILKIQLSIKWNKEIKENHQFNKNKAKLLMIPNKLTYKLQRFKRKTLKDKLK